ncbi:8716_t:CDS:2 [Gigaspora rosea]|nr:8716_t:CDS:2 [Gigaspora rosea]
MSIEEAKSVVEPAQYSSITRKPQDTMAASDPTKPIYTGHENVKEFLLYFEAYAASKDWDDGKKSLVIVLHVADKLKPSMIQLMKVHSTWNNLKAAMITKWATSSNINEKLEHLKNMVQEANDTVQMYTNCFDAYIEEGLRSPYRERVASARPDTYEAAKELAVKMEKYDCNREYISKSPVKITTGKANRVGKEKGDESSATQEPIKVCRVKDQHPLNTERLNWMETNLVEIRRIEIEALGLEEAKLRLGSIVAKSSNIDTLMVKEVDSSNSNHVINTQHKGRLVCWQVKDENDYGTINGMGPE